MPSVHPAAGQSAPRCQPRVEHAHELREHRISAARPAPGAAASPAREQGLRPALRRHDRVAVGDGIYTVAIAWQVYQLSNSPTALSVVGIAWSVPIVLFVLLGGIMSDRFDRRKIMLGAHVVRGSAVALMGALSVAGVLELWHVIAIVAVYAVGEAFFGPAFGAIVPDIVPASQLVQANSLNQLIEPIGLRLAGPAIGGFAIAVIGVGEAFSPRRRDVRDRRRVAPAHVRQLAAAASKGVERSARRELGEAFRFVRARPWLWGTLLSAAVGLLAFVGPVEVLVPYIVKNDLGGGAADLGFVFAAGGCGAVLAALLMGHRGLPRKHIVFLYVTWTLGTFLIAGFGFATDLWQMMAVSFADAGALHGRSDRLGDADAQARAERAARPRVELRLARLRQPHPGLVRPHRPDRRARSARRRR